MSQYESHKHFTRFIDKEDVGQMERKLIIAQQQRLKEIIDLIKSGDLKIDITSTPPDADDSKNIWK